MFLRSLAFALLLSAAHADEALLFGPDRPLPVIVLSPEAEDQERYAADDLKHYLTRMTGQEWNVAEQAPEGQLAIHIGKVAGNDALRDKAKTLGRDGFILDVTPEAIRIAGGSKFGTSFGVYELLERMGVRWFFPGEWGEVVPEVKEIRLKTGRTEDQPVFIFRQMHTARSGQEEGDWFRRSRHNRSGFYGHSLLIRPRDHGAKHPEWYAEIDGVRQVDDPNYKLCHSNPEMVDMAVKEVLEQIRKRNEQTDIAVHDGYRHLAADYNLVSISPRDGGNFCRCEKCLALGSLSDRLQGFANELARRVREVYPDYRVGYYGAYAEHQAPPTIKAEPGVVVIPTTWTRNFFKPLTDISNRTYLEKITAFRGIAPEMVMRDFDGLSVWWGAGPFTLADVHASDYQLYREMGVRGIITEAGSGWGPWGYSYYLLGKLWWNPEADLPALKKDFVEKAYGEAAEPMRTYYELLDRAAVHPPPQDLYTMRQKLEEAAGLATTRGVKLRVNYLRAHFLLNDIFQRFRAEETTPDEIELYHQINASIAPSVSPYTRVGRFLRVFPPSQENRPPLTEPELEALLAKVELPKPGKAFPAWLDQDDLRLVPAPETKTAPPDDQLGVALRFGPATLLIYAQAGEKLDLRQISEKWKAYSTAYELQNPELVTIAEGVAEGETIIDLPAPSTGIYTLRISPWGRYPDLHSSNKHIVLKASGRQSIIQPMGRIRKGYVYVPKGTKEFAIVAKAYEPLTINIEGAIDRPTPQPPIRQTEQQYIEHVITVPAGSDGRIWEIGLAGGKKDIYLQGIPPLISTHPSRLLLLPEAVTTSEP